jgi:hypothetical protein
MRALSIVPAKTGIDIFHVCPTVPTSYKTWAKRNYGMVYVLARHIFTAIPYILLSARLRTRDMAYCTRATMIYKLPRQA